MIILPDRNVVRTKLLLPIHKAQWRTPSQAQPKDCFGRENRTTFHAIGRLHDGHVAWRGVFEDRDDFDAFTYALVCGSLLHERALWRLPTPAWHPDLSEGLRYDFVTVSFLTSSPGGNQTYNVPSDWSALNQIDTLGGGGSGGVIDNNGSPNVATGGGGAAWNTKTGITLTPSGTATYQIGVGGAAVTASSRGTVTAGNNGGDSWFNGATLAASSVGSKAGSGGAASTLSSALSGGAGGVGSSGIGTSSNNGGSGGGVTGTSGTRIVASGGGGAAGSTGAGVAGGTLTTGTNSSAGGAADSGGAGAGTAGALGGGNGGNGSEWDATHGSGGGGGGNASASTVAVAGHGGNYGSGGGAAVGNGTSTSGAGIQGIIFVSYTGMTQVTSLSAIGVAIGLDLVRKSQVAVESISGQNRRSTVNVEARAGVQRRASAQTESFSKVIGGRQAPAESAIAVSARAKLNDENLGLTIITANSQTPIETLRTVTRNDAPRDEALRTAAGRGDGGAEIVAKVARSEREQVEITPRVAPQFPVGVESKASLSRGARTEIESQSLFARGGVVVDEALARVASTGNTGSSSELATVSGEDHVAIEVGANMAAVSAPQAEASSKMNAAQSEPNESLSGAQAIADARVETQSGAAGRGAPNAEATAAQHRSDVARSENLSAARGRSSENIEFAPRLSTFASSVPTEFAASVKRTQAPDIESMLALLRRSPTRAESSSKVTRAGKAPTESLSGVLRRSPDRVEFVATCRSNARAAAESILSAMCKGRLNLEVLERVSKFSEDAVQIEVTGRVSARAMAELEFGHAMAPARQAVPTEDLTRAAGRATARDEAVAGVRAEPVPEPEFVGTRSRNFARATVVVERGKAVVTITTIPEAP